MGVFMLRSYCEQTDLYKSILLSNNQSGKQRIVVFDAPGALRSFLRPSRRGLLYDFHQQQQRVRAMVKAFKQHGYELVVFLDCAIPNEKLTTWYRRRSIEATTLKKLNQHLSTDPPKENMPDGLWLCPNTSLQRLGDAFAEAGCRVFFSFDDSDKEAAYWARENQAYAIITDDTDFLCYPGIDRIWAANVKLPTARSSHIRVSELLRQRLLDSLGLNQQQLQQLAGLLGNDHIKHIAKDKVQKIKDANPGQHVVAALAKNVLELQPALGGSSVSNGSANDASCSSAAAAAAAADVDPAVREAVSAALAAVTGVKQQDTAAAAINDWAAENGTATAADDAANIAGQHPVAAAATAVASAVQHAAGAVATVVAAVTGADGAAVDSEDDADQQDGSADAAADNAAVDDSNDANQQDCNADATADADPDGEEDGQLDVGVDNDNNDHEDDKADQDADEQADAEAAAAANAAAANGAAGHTAPSGKLPSTASLVDRCKRAMQQYSFEGVKLPISVANGDRWLLQDKGIMMRGMGLEDMNRTPGHVLLQPLRIAVYASMGLSQVTEYMCVPDEKWKEWAAGRLVEVPVQAGSSSKRQQNKHRGRARGPGSKEVDPVVKKVVAAAIGNLVAAAAGPWADQGTKGKAADGTAAAPAAEPAPPTPTEPAAAKTASPTAAEEAVRPAADTAATTPAVGQTDADPAVTAVVVKAIGRVVSGTTASGNRGNRGSKVYDPLPKPLPQNPMELAQLIIRRLRSLDPSHEQFSKQHEKLLMLQLSHRTAALNVLRSMRPRVAVVRLADLHAANLFLQAYGLLHIANDGKLPPITSLLHVEAFHALCQHPELVQQVQKSLSDAAPARQQGQIGQAGTRQQQRQKPVAAAGAGSNTRQPLPPQLQQQRYKGQQSGQRRDGQQQRQQQLATNEAHLSDRGQYGAPTAAAGAANTGRAWAPGQQLWQAGAVRQQRGEALTWQQRQQRGSNGHPQQHQQQQQQYGQQGYSQQHSAYLEGYGHGYQQYDQGQGYCQQYGAGASGYGGGYGSAYSSGYQQYKRSYQHGSPAASGGSARSGGYADGSAYGSAAGYNSAARCGNYGYQHYNQGGYQQPYGAQGGRFAGAAQQPAAAEFTWQQQQMVGGGRRQPRAGGGAGGSVGQGRQ